MGRMTSSADLVVLGAGPAGLAAAWRAARRGRSVVVLERSDAVGGLAASFQVGGVSVDHGSHRLHPATPPHLLADLRELLGDDLQLRPRNGRLRIAGRWVGFPLRAGELARALPPTMLARIAAEAAAEPLRRPRADTYAAVLRSGLGRTVYDTLYAPYAKKLWGLPGEQIAGEQARRRVTADTPWKIAGRMLRGGSGGQGRVFYYPRRGFGQIVRSLADAASEAGAIIRTGTAVDAVEPASGSSVVQVTAGASTHVEAAHVFSTIPLPALAAVTRPGPPQAVVDAARRLRFRAMVLVYLVHRGGPWTPYDAHYVPGSETPITRISEPTNYRVSPDDPTDRSVLCAEIPCAVGDAIWRADDDDLRTLAEDALAATGLPPVRAIEVAVRRLPRVYPIYELGYDRHLAGLDAWSVALPRITTFGRLGLFAHDNTHHAMAMAYAAVDALGPDGFDTTEWHAARRRFAEHVVED